MDSFTNSTLSGLFTFMGFVLILIRFEDLQKVPWQLSAGAVVCLLAALIFHIPQKSKWRGVLMAIIIFMVVNLLQG